MNQRRRSAAASDELDGGEDIPMQNLNADRRHSAALSMSSTFSTDTPLMATVVDLDNATATQPNGRTEALNPLDNAFKKKYAANVVSNNKYNVFTFLPLVLFEQFKFFFNLYFLLVALSQFVPQLRIGYLLTYVGPLVFVLAVTMAKEWHDDHARRRRDRDANSQKYQRLTPPGGSSAVQVVASAKIRVGDLILIEKNQRVPADVVLLRTTES
ncbi:putative aminophospholipid-translocase, partial [Coemansia thaxteri]